MVGRVTRKKAAEIAEQLHVDEDAVLDMNADYAAVNAKLATPERRGRSPLGELEPNSAEAKEQEDEPVEELKKSTRGRKAGKKGAAKGKKNNLAASTATLPEGSDVVEDETEPTPSPASEKAAEELLSPEPELSASEVKMQDRSQSPPSAAVRLTRTQIAKRCETEATANETSQTPHEPTDYFVSDNGIPAIETSEPKEMSETSAATKMDAPPSPLPTALPNVIKSLRSDTPGKRSTSNKENVQPESEASSMATPRVQSSIYDALEDAVVSGATPPRSEAHASPRPEDSIAALDELEDAVEIVSRDIPEVQTSPEKKKAKKVQEQEPVKPSPVKEAPKSVEKKQEAKKEAKKAAPVVRTTKAAQARLSMAQNKDTAGQAPGLGRPRPSTMLGRSTSVRQSVAPKPEGASKRVPSNPTTSATAGPKPTKPTATSEPRERKETVIPHSKPRAVPLSFPTPAPPSKSTKATTQSSFQLPGEAVAAKLKAARDARLAREAEKAEKAEEKDVKEKKVAFKARPAPKSIGDAPSVRQTNASRARESIMTGKPAPASSSHKRSNTVANVERPRTVSKDTTLKPTTLAASTARPRPSTSLANISKVRSSLANPTTTGQRMTSGGTTKGKEVFSRAANAKAEAEKAKSEKEVAAKKARAEASERGRQASREWAEKQKLRKLGIKPKSTVLTEATGATEVKCEVAPNAIVASEEVAAAVGEVGVSEQADAAAAGV